MLDYNKFITKFNDYSIIEVHYQVKMVNNLINI